MDRERGLDTMVRMDRDYGKELQPESKGRFEDLAINEIQLILAEKRPAPPPCAPALGGLCPAPFGFESANRHLQLLQGISGDAFSRAPAGALCSTGSSWLLSHRSRHNPHSSHTRKISLCSDIRRPKPHLGIQVGNFGPSESSTKYASLVLPGLGNRIGGNRQGGTQPAIR